MPGDRKVSSGAKKPEGFKPLINPPRPSAMEPPPETADTVLSAKHALATALNDSTPGSPSKQAPSFEIDLSAEHAAPPLDQRAAPSYDPFAPIEDPSVPLLDLEKDVEVEPTNVSAPRPQWKLTVGRATGPTVAFGRRVLFSAHRAFDFVRSKAAPLLSSWVQRIARAGPGKAALQGLRRVLAATQPVRRSIRMVWVDAQLWALQSRVIARASKRWEASSKSARLAMTLAPLGLVVGIGLALASHQPKAQLALDPAPASESAAESPKSAPSVPPATPTAPKAAPDRPNQQELARLYPYGSKGQKGARGKSAPPASRVTFRFDTEMACGDSERCLRYEFSEGNDFRGSMMLRKDSAGRWTRASDDGLPFAVVAVHKPSRKRK